MKLNNLTIVTKNKIIKNASIYIKEKIIKEVKENFKYEDGIDCSGDILLPGFIDIHMHGGYGIDFYNLTEDNIEKLNNNLYKEGVTNYCLANVATNVKVLNNEIKDLSFLIENKNNINNSLIGFYLEGPFISKIKKGAHNIELIEKPDENNLKELLNGVNKEYIKYIVYAPEEATEGFKNYFINCNINLSIGHTNASYYQAEEDYEKYKINHLTHFNNAMTGYDHRKPGVVNFGLLNNDSICELISDGVHNDLSVIKLIYKVKGENKICIITDSMNAKGLKNGLYKLGTLDVIKKDNVVNLASDNTLAGSSATYIHCVKQFIKATGCDLIALNKVTSYNVAKELKIDNKVGLIKKNYLANLVLLDINYNVKGTIVNGEWVYRKGGT